jgi:hypothetical protein
MEKFPVMVVLVAVLSLGGALASPGPGAATRAGAPPEWGTAARRTNKETRGIPWSRNTATHWHAPALLRAAAPARS